MEYIGYQTTLTQAKYFELPTRLAQANLNSLCLARLGSNCVIVHDDDNHLGYYFAIDLAKREKSLHAAGTGLHVPPHTYKRYLPSLVQNVAKNPKWRYDCRPKRAITNRGLAVFHDEPGIRHRVKCTLSYIRVDLQARKHPPWLRISFPAIHKLAEGFQSSLACWEARQQIFLTVCGRWIYHDCYTYDMNKRELTLLARRCDQYSGYGRPTQPTHQWTRCKGYMFSVCLEISQLGLMLHCFIKNKFVKITQLASQPSAGLKTQTLKPNRSLPQTFNTVLHQNECSSSMIIGKRVPYPGTWLAHKYVFVYVLLRL